MQRYPDSRGYGKVGTKDKSQGPYDLPGVAGKDLQLPGLVESKHIEWLRCRAFDFHTGRSNRHPGNGQPADVRFFGYEPLDFGNRNVSFYDVPINDGCVARLEFWRNAVLRFDGRQILDVLCFNRETILLQMAAPVTTAASGRCFENGDNRPALGAWCPLLRPW